MLGGPRFGHERRAAGPLATHSQAKEQAKHGELDDVLCQAAGRGKDGVDQDAERKRPRPPPAVSDEAEKDATGCGGCEGERAEKTTGRAVHAQVCHQRGKDQGVQHHVEGIEEPTK